MVTNSHASKWNIFLSHFASSCINPCTLPKLLSYLISSSQTQTDTGIFILRNQSSIHSSIIELERQKIFHIKVNELIKERNNHNATMNELLEERSSHNVTKEELTQAKLPFWKKFLK